MNTQTKTLIPIILAGGAGTRLWPMSRKHLPKQFLALNSQRTMLQETLLRLKGLDIGKPIVIAGDAHRFLVAEQLREIGVEADILLEPAGKNTAPAIALAANLALARQPTTFADKHPCLLVLAADHVIEDTVAFEVAAQQAQEVAAGGRLVTFGILATEAHTGYGYIKKGHTGLSVNEFEVASFVEKPDQKTAQSYLDSGDYLWNSGMFMFQAQTFLEELAKFSPNIAEPCQKAIAGATNDLDFIRVEVEAFNACLQDSVDCAVMERTDKASVIPLDAGWSDVGSWSSLWDISDKDKEGNHVKNCEVILENSENCMVVGDDRLVAALGLKDLIIVDTKDALLVAHKDSIQDVKKIVRAVKDNRGGQDEFHRVVYRPWGNYDSIDNGDRYQVKRITVKPGEKLSIQMHHHRAEHWVVVSGTAKVQRDEEVLLLSENESVYLPIGAVHALENPGKIPLELIEVQVGGYLGEDDIVRFEDRYGRISAGENNSQANSPSFSLVASNA